MVDSDPAWFNAVLSKHDRDNSIFNVLSVTTEPGSNVGDNYASVIVRATLKVVLGSGKVTTKRLILKKGLSDVPKEIAADMTGAFNLEGIVYDKILAHFETMICGSSVPYSKFWPDCLLTSHNLIMFEDLKMSGFTLGTRQTGLDPEHAKIVFVNLARLHSLSVVAASDGSIYTKMLPPYLMTESGVADNFFRASMTSLADVIRDQWGSEWSAVEKKVRTMIEEILPTLAKLYQEPHKLSVINHGDCWVNNMMFKYDSTGAPVEQKFVDFQLSHYNSYAWDLVYFLHSSVHPKYLLSCQDELIEIYSKEFEDNLARFAFDTSIAPSVQDIKDEMTRLHPFSLAVSTSILPVTANPSNIKISLDEMLNKESTKFRELFEDKDFEKTIQLMFQYLIKTGVL